VLTAALRALGPSRARLLDEPLHAHDEADEDEEDEGVGAPHGLMQLPSGSGRAAAQLPMGMDSAEASPVGPGPSGGVGEPEAGDAAAAVQAAAVQAAAAAAAATAAAAAAAEPPSQVEPSLVVNAAEVAGEEAAPPLAGPGPGSAAASASPASGLASELSHGQLPGSAMPSMANLAAGVGPSAANLAAGGSGSVGGGVGGRRSGSFASAASASASGGERAAVAARSGGDLIVGVGGGGAAAVHRPDSGGGGGAGEAAKAAPREEADAASGGSVAAPPAPPLADTAPLGGSGGAAPAPHASREGGLWARVAGTSRTGSMQREPQQAAPPHGIHPARLHLIRESADGEGAHVPDLDALAALRAEDEGPQFAEARRKVGPGAWGVWGLRRVACAPGRVACAPGCMECGLGCAAGGQRRLASRLAACGGILPARSGRRHPYGAPRTCWLCLTCRVPPAAPPRTTRTPSSRCCTGWRCWGERPTGLPELCTTRARLEST
jgi:hypothetical protein